MIMFLLPIIQSLGLNLSVGNDIKGMKIAVKIDEKNSLDCQHSVVRGCILDEGRNQTISCIVTNYLLSHDYQLVSIEHKCRFRKSAIDMVKNNWRIYI